VNLLDPRFKYIPAAETDVASTWKRFGFDPAANPERRARLKRSIAEAEAAPAVLSLVRTERPLRPDGRSLNGR
jgi:hypothetical protein